MTGFEMNTRTPDVTTFEMGSPAYLGKGDKGDPGEDGVSPEVTVSAISGGHRVSITDRQHPSGQSFDVLDGEDGADGTNGQDGKSAYASAQDGGYTGTEQQFNSDLANVGEKIDEAPNDGQQYARKNKAWAVVQGGGGGAVIDDTAGAGDTDKAWSADKLTSELDAKADKPTIKTAMDSVAAVNTQYFLGTQSAVSIVLPSNAEVGSQLSAVWYNGATAATLSVTGTVLTVDYTPSANSRSEINALWDGTYWAVVTNEQAVTE